MVALFSISRSMEKFVIAAGAATRYTCEGIGTLPIVLIHGYLESIEVWDGFAGELGKTLKVLAMDIPGHGVSQVKGEVHTMEFCADAVAEIMEKAQIDRAVIVGHSMGGYIAQSLCRKYPEKVAGLVLLHSSPNGDSDEKRENRRREIEIIKSSRKELLASTNPGKGFAKVNRKKFTEEIADIADQVMFTDDDGIVALLEGMMLRPESYDVVSSLEVPSLLCFGKQDEYIPVEAAEAIIEKLPKSQVAWFENSGHMSFIEERDECVRVIKEFCDECYKVCAQEPAQ